MRQGVAAVAALAILVGLAALAGYAIGVQVGSGPRMSELKTFRDVPAYVGDAQATAQADGVSYGVSGSVPWVDAIGGTHWGSWPECLPRRSQTRITFSGAMVYGPTGAGDARILWVDCRR